MDDRLDASDFDDFFAAVQGSRPFPWQSRLAARLARGEGWPDALDLPTATGKTAAIDIALFHLALEAGRPERRAPLRVVLVGERRTFIDAAWARAHHLAAALGAATSGVLLRVRTRLAELAGVAADGPLALTLCHGPDEAARARSLGARIAVETVDDVLARLRASAGCDAAASDEADLLGRDVVWLFDEIGASAPLRAALAAVERRHRARPPAGAPGAVIVDLTATGHRASGGDVFTLDDDDRRDPVLARRLTTKKTVLLWQDIPENTFSGVCASAVGAYIVGGASAIAVVANQHVTARAILRRVRDEVADLADVTLVSGHMRPIDRADAEARLLPRIAAGHRRRGRDVRPIVVVGTQCLEAGPDFDFDALVSEGASLDALRQRFGRLNRLGELAAAPGAIVMRTRALADDPVYGVAARETAAWLAAQEHIDFAPARMQEPERALLARLVTRPSDQRPSGDGPSAAEVRVVWRRDLDESLIELAGRPQGAEDAWGARARRVVQESLTALPPSPPELMRLPLAAVRCWLLGLPEVAVTDLEGVPASNQDGGKATRNRPVVRWRDGVSETVRAADLAAGDVIIVPPSYGGVVEGNWDATSAASVADRAEESAFATHGTAVLRLHYSILKTAGIIEAPLPSPTLPDELVVGAWLERVKPRAGSWVGAMLERLQAARGRWHIRRVSAVSGADTYIISADPS